jgi:DNA polymerase III delta prime subunit
MEKEVKEEFLFVEKYRPHKIADCILPDRLKQVFQEYVNQKVVPNLMLTGTAGTGKTTVARALCDEIGLDYLFINGSEERGIDMLRTKIKNYASTMSLHGGSKVIILDEADNLTPDAQLALRASIEAFSSNCTFIFTCNFKARLIDAIHSRCAVIDFKLESSERPKMAAQMFKRVEEILKLEGVTYDKAVLAKIVEKYFPDYRRTLGELQKFAMLGNIDAGVVSQLSDIRKMNELVAALKDKNFTAMRKWVANNSDVDSSRIFRSIYDSTNEFFKPSSIPLVVVTIAKYQYQAAFVADQEINLVACLTEIMIESEFI